MFIGGLVVQSRTRHIFSSGGNGLRRLRVDCRSVSETNINPQPSTGDCFIRVAQRSFDCLRFAFDWPIFAKEIKCPWLVFWSVRDRKKTRDAFVCLLVVIVCIFRDVYSVGLLELVVRETQD